MSPIGLATEDTIKISSDNIKGFRWALAFLNALKASEYSGKVEINFFKGGVTNINKLESFKPDSFDEKG